MTPASPVWRPPVETCSALTGKGLQTIWQRIGDHRRALGATGEFEERRRAQRVRWMWSTIHDQMMQALDHDQAVRAVLERVEPAVAENRLPPRLAAARVLAAVRPAPGDGTD